MKCPYCEFYNSRVGVMTRHIMSHKNQQERTKERAKAKRRSLRERTKTYNG